MWLWWEGGLLPFSTKPPPPNQSALLFLLMTWFWIQVFFPAMVREVWVLNNINCLLQFSQCTFTDLHSCYIDVLFAKDAIGWASFSSLAFQLIVSKLIFAFWGFSPSGCFYLFSSCEFSKFSMPSIEISHKSELIIVCWLMSQRIRVGREMFNISTTFSGLAI